MPRGIFGIVFLKNTARDKFVEMGKAMLHVDKLKCPGCGSKHYDICSVMTQIERQTVNQGQWNGMSWCDAGDTGGPIRTFCECNVCGHHWKPRKIKSIHDLVNLDIIETAHEVKLPNR